MASSFNPKGMAPSSKGITGPSLLENGRKVYTVNGTSFEVPGYMEITRNIGLGAYGLVCSAVDNRSNTKLAVKKCNNVFGDVGDGKRVLREVKLLKIMRHENILNLRTFYAGSGKFDGVYIVTDLLDTDLQNVIRSKHPISEEHVKYFVYQILRGLKFVHSANVVHRDIKPQNILVSLNCDLRICDFGLARGVVGAMDAVDMTDYVVTRWYRPPELIMLNKHYSTAVDLWSVGCIFAEMINRQTLFPGKDYITQLRMIADSIGVPDLQEMEGTIENKEAVKFVQSLGHSTGKPLDEIVRSNNPEAIDFASKMLAFLPEKRWTAAQLMSHPYLQSLHDPADEPSAPALFNWEFDSVDVTREQLREMFIAEANEYPDVVDHE